MNERRSDGGSLTGRPAARRREDDPLDLPAFLSDLLREYGPADLVVPAYDPLLDGLAGDRSGRGSAFSG